MANALIKKKNTTGGIDKTRFYIDEKAENYENTKADKEDVIRTISYLDFMSLTEDVKKNKTYLVTGAPNGEIPNYAITNEISRSSTDLEIPTSKAVYEATKESGFIISVVDVLPSISDAKPNYLYLVKDSNSDSYIEYYLKNTQWEIAGIGTDLSLYATKKQVPFKFGVNGNGEYGYYKNGATSITPFAKSAPPSSKRYVLISDDPEHKFNLSPFRENERVIDLSDYGITNTSGEFIFSIDWQDQNESMKDRSFISLAKRYIYRDSPAVTHYEVTLFSRVSYKADIVKKEGTKITLNLLLPSHSFHGNGWRNKRAMDETVADSSMGIGSYFYYIY